MPQAGRPRSAHLALAGRELARRRASGTWTCPRRSGPSRPVTPGGDDGGHVVERDHRPVPARGADDSIGCDGGTAPCSSHDLHRAHPRAQDRRATQAPPRPATSAGIGPGERVVRGPFQERVRPARSRTTWIESRESRASAPMAPTMPRTSSSPTSSPKNARPATRALRESDDTASAGRLSESEATTACSATAGPSQASSHLRNCPGASASAIA